MPRTAPTRRTLTRSVTARPALLLPLVAALGLALGVTLAAGPAAAADSGTTAPAPEPTPDTSNPPPDAPAATRLAVHLPTRVEWGQTVTVTVRLTRTDGTPVEGAPVTVYARPTSRDTFSGLARVTTGADGLATTAYRPAGGTVFTARWAGDTATEGSASPERGLGVVARLTSQVDPASVPRFSTVTVSGAVGPARPGGVVSLQRFTGGVWRYQTAAQLDSSSRYAFRLTPEESGSWLVRVVAPATGDLLQAVGPGLRYSAGERVLRQGMTGEDVLAVELRLAALRYDVGAADGRYTYDTAHAVQAFHKVQGLPRTQTVTDRTRSALARPRVPALRQSRSGVWVEADLTRQVLYIGRSGRLDRVLDISSGNNELYTADGRTSRAVTPQGQFRINRKINGERISRLGVLYKPAYFNTTGYAIHGSPSVPAYPASHGCIRITNPAADRYYSTLAVGVPVSIYRS